MQTKVTKWLMSCLILLLCISVLIGRYSLPDKAEDYINDAVLRNLILKIRIPRILIAILTGVGLASTGLIIQNIFRNPLADPGILGINQAAGFGAAMGILYFNNNYLIVQILAFMFGVLALVMSLWISKNLRKTDKYALILAGISVSALFSAGLGILKYTADPQNDLPSIVFWLLGSLSTSNWGVLLRLLPIIFASIGFLYLKRWRINAFSLDSEIQFSLGIKNNREINFVLIASVLLTTSIVSFSGIIGWVGLIIPNIGRYIVGIDLRKSLPLTMIMGGIFTLFCDNISRSLIPGEIPLGILTALLGSLLFVTLLNVKKDFI